MTDIPYDAIAANTTGRLLGQTDEDAMDLTQDDPWLWAAVYREECLQGPHTSPAPLMGHGQHAWLAAVHRDRPCLHIGCADILCPTVTCDCRGHADLHPQYLQRQLFAINTGTMTMRCVVEDGGA